MDSSRKKIKRVLTAVVITLWFLIALLLMISCGKEITPGNYTLGQELQDSSNWQSNYVPAGVLPSFGVGNTNELTGTKWVLVRYNIGGFNTLYPNDTIMFIENNRYTVNNSPIFDHRTYQISNLVGSPNKSLSLNFFPTFGGSIYSGQVGQFFVSDGFSNETYINFSDLYSNTNINSWIIRIL